MQFRLTTMLWLFALLAAGMGTFGPIAGILATAFVLLLHWARLRGGLAGCLFTVFIIVWLAFLMLPVVNTAREAGRRMTCMNNMKLLHTAMLSYEIANGALPPAYTVDSNGKPLHSWRVLILPYMEQSELYESIRLDEPWDSAHNRRFTTRMPEVFRCPGCARCASHTENPWRLPGANCTNYFAVVGDEAAMLPDEPRPLHDIADSVSQTLLLVEAADRSVNWMQPKDLSLEEAIEVLSNPNVSRHIRVRESLWTTTFQRLGSNAIFVDGHSWWHGTLSRQDATAMLTIASGDNTTDEPEESVAAYTSVTIIRWGHVFSFALFVVLALAPLFYNRRPRTGGDVGSADDVAGDAKPP